MAVWSGRAQRPFKGVWQQAGGGKGAAPQRGRGEGSQAVFRQGTRAGRSRAQRGPGEHEARSAGPCTARGKTRSPRGAGERVSPLPPEGPARPLVGVGEAHGLRGGGISSGVYTERKSSPAAPRKIARHVSANFVSIPRCPPEPPAPPPWRASRRVSRGGAPATKRRGDAAAVKHLRGLKVLHLSRVKTER